MLVSGKVAIVTGGSRGIGRAIAVALAREGAKVVVNHHRGADRDFGEDAPAKGTLAAIEAVGGEGVLVEGDVASPETAERLVEAAVSRFGGVDIHVSNAGICPFHAFLDMPLDLFRTVVDVNLQGAFVTTQAAARQMVKQDRGGAIIAISSISALVGGAMQSHYTPTKAGVHSLMQSIAIALGPHGIRCNSVMPGAIETDINKDDWSDPEKRAYLDGRVPARPLRQARGHRRRRRLLRL